MSNLTYQAVCYTENCFIGPKTSNHQDAYQDEQDHLQNHPDHDVDIQITQTFGMSGTFVNPKTIKPFERS